MLLKIIINFFQIAQTNLLSTSVKNIIPNFIYPKKETRREDRTFQTQENF